MVSCHISSLSWWDWTGVCVGRGCWIVQDNAKRVGKYRGSGKRPYCHAGTSGLVRGWGRMRQSVYGYRKHNIAAVRVNFSGQAARRLVKVL